MAGHRGAAGVVQCDPWASSAISAVPTGTEVPSASEDAQCVSCTTHEGSWWSSYCAEIQWQHSSPEWSSPHSSGGHGACTPSCNTVGVSHAVVGCGDPALIPLQEALKKAKAQAAKPPLADRVSASEMHVARKKKCFT